MSPNEILQFSMQQMATWLLEYKDGPLNAFVLLGVRDSEGSLMVGAHGTGLDLTYAVVAAMMKEEDLATVFVNAVNYYKHKKGLCTP